MTNPKARRNPSLIESSKYAPNQSPTGDRRQRFESLGQDPAEIARAKREIAQISRQQGGRASAAIQLDDVDIQQRKPRQMVAAPEPLPPPAPVPGADVPQFVELHEPFEGTATIDQQSPPINNRPIQRPGVSEQKQAQTSGVSSSRPRFQHIEHQPVRSATPTRSMPVAQGAAYPRDEVSTHWEAFGPPVRIQPLILLLVVALVSIAVIWRFLQSPNQTFISSYSGAQWGNSVGDVVSGLFFNQDAKSRIASIHVPAGEHSVVGDPSINAAAIDTILSKYGSPAVGTGQAWIKLGQQYGIDPAYAVAFFIHESGAGTNPGWAGIKPDGSTTHNVGNIICAGYATCYNRFRDYTSWDEGIADWYKLISNEYVGGRGVASVEQIIPIYAPSSDNNDVPGYINVVVSMVEGWHQGVVR